MEQKVEVGICICMIPTPGMGHLIPLAELARRLTQSSFNLSVTFLIPTTHDSPPTHSQLALLNSLPPSISHTFLPPVHVSDLPHHSPIETRILLTLTRSIPAIRHSLRLLSTSSTRLAALVVDLFGYPLFEVANQFGVLPYMFFLTSALGLCFAFKLPTLHQMYTCEYKDLPEPHQFCPGSVPIHGSDFIDPVQDRKAGVYTQLLHMVQKYEDAAGIFVNSFYDLEPAALTYLRDNDKLNSRRIPKIYPIGPLIHSGLESEGDGGRCLRWLDEQPHGSVLYVSFGSGGTLSHLQMTELAYGLELGGVRFLWVVKTPNDRVPNATYFTVDSSSADDPLAYLPSGFLERIRGVGLVVPSWAPQVQVLSHGSTGGFLTHCGWNSIMESVVCGVPFIAWPLFAEQKFNAVLLAQDLKVGMRVKGNEKGLVEREEVGKCARSLIEGEEGRVMRERVRDLKHKADAALAEGGSFNKSLAEVAQVWMNHTATAKSVG